MFLTPEQIAYLEAPGFLAFVAVALAVCACVAAAALRRMGRRA